MEWPLTHICVRDINITSTIIQVGLLHRPSPKQARRQVQLGPGDWQTHVEGDSLPSSGKSNSSVELLSGSISHSIGYKSDEIIRDYYYSSKKNLARIIFPQLKAFRPFYFVKFKLKTVGRSQQWWQAFRMAQNRGDFKLWRSGKCEDLDTITLQFLGNWT